MRYGVRLSLVWCLVVFVWSGTASAQVLLLERAPLPLTVQTTPAPSTRLEEMQPKPGSLRTLSYEQLGEIATGRVSIDVQIVEDGQGHRADGFSLRLTHSERRETVYIDSDEVTPLLAGLDTILAVATNPTRLKSFDMRYTTKALVSFVVYSDHLGATRYAVQTGHVPQVTVSNLDVAEMRKLRAMLERGQAYLAEVARVSRFEPPREWPAGQNR